MEDRNCSTLPLNHHHQHRRRRHTSSCSCITDTTTACFSPQQKAAAWAWHQRCGGSLLPSSAAASASSPPPLLTHLRLAPPMSRFHAESVTFSKGGDNKNEFKSPALFDALELSSFALHLDRTICSSFRTYSMPHFTSSPPSLYPFDSYELEEEQEGRGGPRKPRVRRWKQRLLDGMKKMAIPFR